MHVDRRFFLIGSALSAQAFQSEKPVNTAMIGIGGRGSFLLQGVLRQPNAKVLALCDIKPDRLDKAASAAARDNPATIADWRRVIENQDVDAVFIATPPYLHSEMAIQAIEAGKHVYCEKPLGVTPAQVRALLDAARGSRKVFVAGQQLRSQKQLAETVRKIREGVIGDVIMVKAQRHAAADLPHDGSSADWYFDVTKSGGYLIEQSVHNLDLCNWAIGSHPLRASGFGGILFYKNDPPGRTIFDCGSITYDYPNAVKMSFTQNVFHPASMPHGNQYVYVYGTKGAVDLMTASMYPPGRGSQPVLLAPKQEEDQYAHIAAFYDSILHGTPPPVDIRVGATAALTAILGHDAMVQEKVVKWSDFGVDL
ncbi:MAG TPA: Gfo/Idh/MocA family oxidoreductase [Candidatus Acidoferrales bacterium]|jgi:myo-inositol 2-dehydrogenase/D-chiro-inositol 1-dehydrogenase|nr:Gfo/Idh/MocA family oxidoreductase [Candidatus Acidoferrales bacterium]